MIFWATVIALALLTTLYIALPLLRRPQADTAPNANADVLLYKDQLAEVERDIARGVLATEEAERTRTEIGRRLLAANQAVPAPQGTAPQGLSRGIVVLAVLSTLAGGGALYWQLGAPGYPDIPRADRLANAAEMLRDRPTQAEAEAAVPDAARPAIELPDDQKEIVTRLRQIVADNPDELQGWQYLSSIERRLGDFAAAARAQNEVIRIKGDATTTEELAYLVDMMVAAANGVVSLEAQAVLNEIVSRESDSIVAAYYMGQLYSQTDRPDIAFRLWRDVVEKGDAESLHVRLARGQIEEAAFKAGLEYTLPPERGPSAADIAAASDMNAEDRDAMIRGMVAQLSDRLANEGGPASDWARLINAYGVLGDTEQAEAIWLEAREVFGTSEAAMEILRAAAQSAGVAVE